MGDYWENEKLPLKVPFTTSKEEIANYYIHAGQFGTFGTFFSGMFILMIIILIYAIIRNIKIFLIIMITNTYL